VLVTLREPSKSAVMQVGAFVTDALRIQRVTLHAAGSEPSATEVFSGAESSAAYGGPIFDELDETMQNAFYDFLAQRGVDDELAALKAAQRVLPSAVDNELEEMKKTLEREHFVSFIQ
jgi:hypothetical protein